MASPASIPQKEPSAAQIELPFTYIFVVTDLCLRYLLLVLWRVSFISSVWFWIGQICVVSFPLLALINHRRNHLSSKYNIPPNSLGIKNAAHWILATFILMIHGAFQTFERVGFRTHWLHVTVATLLTMIYALYILSIAVGSLRDEFPDTQEKILSPQEIVDENDRLLIHLKTEIATFERRVESYTIESTLIGGIAFSAFVTIVSSEKAQLQGVTNFLAYTSSMFSALLTANVTKLREAAGQPHEEHMLLAGIACLALVCSMFFVAVIIARLRFNGLVGFANYSTQTAEAFNEKEEHLARQLILHPKDHPPEIETRLASMSEQIAESLSGAKVMADQLRPIIHYMGVFRHLGVLSFLGALVASALWLAPSLAVCFGIIGIIAYGYPSFDRWVRDGRLRRSKLFRLPYLLRSRR